MSNQRGASLGPPPRRTIRRKGAVSLAAIAVLLAAAAPAFGARLKFKADLTGGGEAPPNTSPGKAHLEGALDTDTNALTWTVIYSGLTGAPIGAHFHGPVSYIGLTPEENAPIQVGTTGNLASPFKGSATIDEAQKKDLKGGRWYFNIHTPAFPSGEIRGPVVME